MLLLVFLTHLLDDSVDYFTSLVGNKNFIKVLNKIDLENQSVLVLIV